MMGVKREREGKWRAVSVPLRGNVNNDKELRRLVDSMRLPFPSPYGEM